MPIPKPSETKQPVLNYLAKAKEPVKVVTITESMGKYFKLGKKELAEGMPKNGKDLRQE